MNSRAFPSPAPNASGPETDIRIVHERPEATKVPRLWSVRSLAARFDISRRQLYRAVQSGRLPCIRILGCVRVLEEDVLRLLEMVGEE